MDLSASEICYSQKEEGRLINMPSRIHFLNTDNSDCIILESNGLFAMVDAGEDAEYPPDKPHLNLKGFEKDVIQYINKPCLPQIWITTTAVKEYIQK